MKITYYSSTAETLIEIGNRIRDTRITISKTQGEIAKMTNLSLHTISNIENGKDVSFSSIIEVLRALGLLQNLETLIHAQGIRPSQIAHLGKKRQRASRKQKENMENQKTWKWGDEK